MQYLSANFTFDATMSAQNQPPAFVSALFIIDVQNHLAIGPTGVPDAEKIRHAISIVLELTRQHNGNMMGQGTSDERVKIVFVQHNDSDLDDPLYKGKESWGLVFRPQAGDDAEILVQKDEGELAITSPLLSVDSYTVLTS